ncbi:MAG: hypothetical protein LBS97_00250 [Treponema sp.]|jgi:hypothetical protein|nr:hypothetical protein [Treponema sp.]
MRAEFPEKALFRPAFCLTVVLLFAACTPKNADTLVDVSVFEKGLEYGVQWAVVSDPYATFRSASDFSAPVSGYGRRGDIQKVTGQVIVPGASGSTVWYGFDKGWLPANSIIIYSNEIKARRASESFRE